MRQLALALASMAVLASAASAQPPAGRPSPDSPAGVEYQLPLERARSEAGVPPTADPAPRSAGGGAEGAGNEQLFGEGIERSEAAGGKRHAAGDQPDRRRPSVGSSSGHARSRVAVAAGPGDESKGPLVAAIVAGVLAAAAALGLGLRAALHTR